MKKHIYYIILLFFIQGVLHNLGHPVTPAFVRSLGIEDYMFGVFFAAMSLGLMIGGPLWGIQSDRGKRPLLAASGLIIYSIGQVLFAYAHDETLMVIFRFIAGFGAVSSITIFTAELIRLSEVKNRAKNLAFAAASATLGASIGYYVGGFLNQNTFFVSILRTDVYEHIFLIQAILNALFAGLALILIQNEKPQTSLAPKVNFITGLKQITKVDTSLLIFMISLVFMTLGAINLSKYIDVYFDELGYSPSDLGTFVFATGIVSLFSSIFIVPLFAKMKKQLLVIGITHIIASIIVFIVFRGLNFLLLMYTVYMIYVVIKAIYTPLEQNYISRYAKENQYGSIMGLRQSFVSLGMVVGPLLGGFIYDIKPLYLFDFSAVSFLIGVVLLIFVYLLEKKQLKA